MTKKEQKLFERVLSMNNGDVDKIDGVYRFNNFYYATNGVMAVRTLDEPKSPMVPDEVQTSDESLYKRVEEIFEDSIIHGKPIELPTKKELVEVRKNLAVKDKCKPYIMDCGEMIFALNNSYLNWFLDVFEGGKYLGYSPVKPFYFINKGKTIDAILFPVRVGPVLEAKYLAHNRKEHIL